LSYPWWEVTLETDGSAHKSVGWAIHTSRQIRVNVSPGQGPREITALDESSLCGFKYVPD
jgi:hypothetical protein